MDKQETWICYRFQCARYLTCGLSGGTGCCLERDPVVKELPADACTKENGYPYFKPGREENPVHVWMRNH